MLGAADGSFMPAGSADLQAVPRDIAAGDFDGDGLADLAVTHMEASLSILRGEGDGAFALTAEPLTLPGVGVAIGDLQGDGRDDVVLATAQFPEGGVTVLWSR
ncbi:MAG: VCBS repeat-containing protein [Myxococcota bacterium]